MKQAELERKMLRKSKEPEPESGKLVGYFSGLSVAR